MHERILWLRYRPDLRIRLDGVWQKLVFDQPEPAPPTKATPTMVRRYMVEKRRATYNPMRYVPTTRPDKIYRRLALSPPVRKKYAHSWVLMDRIHNAGDSGEILFKHLRAHHPEINAWFVLAKESSDYDRLRKEGYGDRLVPHGSRQWRLLMANCEHLLASHADEPVVKPPADRGVHRAPVALHLPPARRDQGRPLALAQLQEHRPVRDQHGAGVHLDRR